MPTDVYLIQGWRLARQRRGYPWIDCGQGWWDSWDTNKNHHEGGCRRSLHSGNYLCCYVFRSLSFFFLVRFHSLSLTCEFIFSNPIFPSKNRRCSLRSPSTRRLIWPRSPTVSVHPQKILRVYLPAWPLSFKIASGHTLIVALSKFMERGKERHGK